MRKYTARILLPQRVMIPIVGAGFAVVVAVGVYHAVFGSDDRSPEHRLAEERASSLVNSAWILRTERGQASCPSSADFAGRQSVVDPWGQSFVIECERDAIRAISLGPDGARGTSDDVVAEGPPAD